MDDEQLEENNKKYEYLNAPCLLEDFKSNYLTSLNIFLNDQKFKEKTDSLPVLKSSAITKYEKLISKEEAEKLKKKSKDKNRLSSKLQPLNIENENSIKNKFSSTTPNMNKKQILKGIQVRYIIIDHELIEISLQAIEENNEINNKLTDPFNAYFHEQNPKIRKKALEQIINNIMPNKTNNKEMNKNDINKNDEINLNINNTNTNNFRRKSLDKKINNNINISNTGNNFFKQNKLNNNKNNILYTDLEILKKRYENYDLEQKKKEEKYAPILKLFKDNCNTHNIITLDQKIDYFVYLYKNNMLKVFKPKENAIHKTLSKKIIKKFSASKIQTPSNKNNSIFNYNNSNSNNKGPTTFSYYNLLDNNLKYINELKNNFRINDETYNIHHLEQFERDLDTKIKSFQLVKKNLESSPKFIDKLRMYLKWEEVSQEKIILRNCEITSDRLYFLINKKYFDFGNIKHLNLANNNLGDMGGSYLLWLVSKFSTKIDYLNINNNKIGKQTCEILIDILQKNVVKLYGLSIGGNKIGDKLFSEISIGISKNTFLNKLFINDNELGKISSVILGSILKYDKKLKLLDVSKNNFGDENIGYMLKGLICNTALETLMINNLGLTNKSLRIFETTLCINSTLKKLFLERNKINYKGWRLLSEILNKNKYIEYVSLVGNNFENEHINYIMEQQRQIKVRSISKSDYFMQITSGNEEVNLYEYLD